MADIPLTNIVSPKSAGIALAPDLTFPSSVLSGAGYSSVTGIDPSGGLTTLLNLTGKYIIDYIRVDSMTAENVTVKLTVDGSVVWNDTFTSGTQLQLIGDGGDANAVTSSSGVLCNSSFLLELQTATDNNVRLQYLVRPII